MLSECPFCDQSVNLDAVQSAQWFNFHLQNHKLIAECKKLGLKENKKDE